VQPLFLGKSFDKANPQKTLLPSERQKVDEILGRLLNDLARSWRSIASVQCANLTLCDQPHDRDITL
jgi:hypothetical protein